MNLVDAFKSEAGEHLAQAERCLLRIDSDSSDIAEDIDEIFRAIHTVKGAAGYLDHQAVLQLSHALESVLELFRSHPLGRPSDDQIDVFFRALDALQTLADNAETSADDDVSDFIKVLNAMHEALGGTGVRMVRTPDAVNQDPFINCLDQQLMAINAALPKFVVGELPAASALSLLLRAAETTQNAAAYVGHDDINGAAGALVDWLKAHRETVWTQTELNALSIFVVDLVKMIRTVVGQFKSGPTLKGSPSEPDQDRSQHPRPPSSDLNPLPVKRSADHAIGSAPANIIRIDRSAVDGVMNLVGELIVARNNFEHLFSELTGPEANREAALKGFRTAYGTLRHISERMQDTVMDMRMIPVEVLFSRFPKVVRDLCRQLKKSVVLHMEGIETKIDRSIAEQLSDPLLHLVRNAIDHGSEDATSRRLAGKSEQGQIFLKARQEHHSIIIEVCDDGCGMDVNKIRQKSVANGLLNAQEADEASASEVLQMVFLPGFSTAKAVSEVSGRGVGLDVVKKNIERLKGSVTIDTHAGTGTTMRIVVPMTMAIMNAILVRAGKGIYACPLSAVQEVVKFPRKEVRQVALGRVASLRGEIIGLKCLNRLLGLEPQADGTGEDHITALIVGTSEGRVAVAVDSIFRKEEIVVKSLSQELAESQLLMGASILGNGEAILILDPSVLVQMNPANLGVG